LKKILILGGSGYLGSRLSYLLANEGNNVDVVSRSKVIKNKNWLEKINKVIIGDIRESKLLDSITNKSYDCLINLVSLDNNKSNKHPEFVNSVNVMPVWNLLELFNKKNNLNQFIYFSTIHVYDRSYSEISESSFLNPKSKYGLTHLLSENIVNHYNSTTNITCLNLRLSNSYGSPYFSNIDCWNLVVNDFCKMAFYNNEIIINSDGTGLCDFVHFQDVFNAVSLLIIKNELEHNIFNLTSSISTSIYDLALLIKKIFKRRLNKDIVINRLVEKPVFFKNDLTFKNDRFKKIGLDLEVDLESGINELIDYFENEK